MFSAEDGRTLRARVSSPVMERIRSAEGLPQLAEVSEWIMAQGTDELFELSE
jgi:hypothetical protein